MPRTTNKKAPESRKFRGQRQRFTNTRRAADCGRIGAGSNKTAEAPNLCVNEVFSCSEFQIPVNPGIKVLDVGRAYPQGWPHRFGGVVKTHVHSLDLTSQSNGSEFPEGIKTMSTTKPTMGKTAPTTEAALRDILNEVTPGIRPYSTDSWLPCHLIEAAQAALEAHSAPPAANPYSLARNALLAAIKALDDGKPETAFSRLRRARSHLAAAMETRNARGQS